MSTFAWSRSAVPAQGHPREPKRHSWHDLLAASHGRAEVLSAPGPAANLTGGTIGPWVWCGRAGVVRVPWLAGNLTGQRATLSSLTAPPELKAAQERPGQVITHPGYYM
jgi:hypothetical protein